MQDTDTTLRTASDVIAALGGTADVQALTSVESPQVVSNWVGRNRFAANTFVLMTDRLKTLGFEADHKLWGMKVAEDALEGVQSE